MMLLTKEITAKLLSNGKTPDEEHIPVAKLFYPAGGATWLLTEIDPTDHDRAFGLCDIGVGEPELGWVSLTELRNFRGRLGTRIERDRYFDAKLRSLKDFAAEARRLGHINA